MTWRAGFRGEWEWVSSGWMAVVRFLLTTDPIGNHLNSADSEPHSMILGQFIHKYTGLTKKE
jgi:hypothetical protein